MALQQGSSRVQLRNRKKVKAQRDCLCPKSNLGSLEYTPQPRIPLVQDLEHIV